MGPCFYPGTAFFSSFLHSASTPCNVSLGGVHSCLGGSSLCVFRLQHLRGGIWATFHPSMTGWRAGWLRFPCVWENSSSLMESTWFTAGQTGAGHRLTDSLKDSGGKRDPLFVLLLSECHHPLPRPPEKVPALGLTLGGRGQALELVLSHRGFFCQVLDPGS